MPARVVAPMRVNLARLSRILRARALIDDDVELEVLHCGVEVFLDRGLQTMNLIDEQHSPALDIC